MKPKRVYVRGVVPSNKVYHYREIYSTQAEAIKEYEAGNISWSSPEHTLRKHLAVEGWGTVHCVYDDVILIDLDEGVGDTQTSKGVLQWDVVRVSASLEAYLEYTLNKIDFVKVGY